MQAGQLDGYFGDLLNTVLLIQNGVPIRIVTVAYATARVSGCLPCWLLRTFQN